MQMSIEMSKDKIKLSKADQTLEFKLTVAETKLAEIEANLAEDDDSDQASIDVFCVIDRSGSMRGEKLKQVKISLGYLIELLKPNDRISITCFDSYSQLVLAPKCIGKSKKLIQDAIDWICDQGTTNIRSGLETAFTAMIGRKTKNQVAGVMLLTDGLDNAGLNGAGPQVDQFFASWKDKLKNDEFTLHTFGYGHDHDPALMEQMAGLNGGDFYYVSNLETVSDTFVDCLGGLLSVIGQGATITIKLLQTELWPEIRFKRTYGDYFVGHKETERMLNLKNIVKDYKKDFMFEVTLPGCKMPDCLDNEPELTRMIESKMTATNLENVQYTKECTFEGMIYNSESNVDIVTNPEVEKNMARVRAGDAIEEANNLASKGQYEAGEHLLSANEALLDKYQDDEMFRHMKKNVIKNRECIANSRQGINNDMNVNAFVMNSKSVFCSQKAAPQMMMGECNMNRAKKKMATKLTVLKSNNY